MTGEMKCNGYPTIIMMTLCYSAAHNGNVFMIRVKAKSVDYLTLVGTNCKRLMLKLMPLEN